MTNENNEIKDISHAVDNVIYNTMDNFAVNYKNAEPRGNLSLDQMRCMVDHSCATFLERAIPYEGSRFWEYYQKKRHD